MTEAEQKERDDYIAFLKDDNAVLEYAKGLNDKDLLAFCAMLTLVEAQTKDENLMHICFGAYCIASQEAFARQFKPRECN